MPYTELTSIDELEIAIREIRTSILENINTILDYKWSLAKCGEIVQGDERFAKLSNLISGSVNLLDAINAMI